jgi:hypothetical protein
MKSCFTAALACFSVETSRNSWTSNSESEPNDDAFDRNLPRSWNGGTPTPPRSKNRQDAGPLTDSRAFAPLAVRARASRSLRVPSSGVRRRDEAVVGVHVHARPTVTFGRRRSAPYDGGATRPTWSDPADVERPGRRGATRPTWSDPADVERPGRRGATRPRGSSGRGPPRSRSRRPARHVVPRRRERPRGGALVVVDREWFGAQRVGASVATAASADAPSSASRSRSSAIRRSSSGSSPSS